MVLAHGLWLSRHALFVWRNEFKRRGIQAVAFGYPSREPLADNARRQEAAGEPAVLLVAPKIRPWVARLMRYSTPNLAVLAYNEIPENRRIRVIAAVGR